MAREKIPEVEKLKKEGKTVWSFSRLDCFENCKLSYKYGYIDKVNGKDNIYNLVGTFMHDNKEAYLNKLTTKEKWLSDFDDYIFELQMNGVNFPNEIIKNNYVESISHYIKHQEDNNNKNIIEKFVLYQIDENNWIQGYIDYIDVKDGIFRIIDFKTSSEYTGEKKIKAGRQLILYKIILEYITGRNVSFVGWDMMKYCYVCKKQKNGKIKRYFIQRNKIAKEMKSRYYKDLISIGKLDFEADMIVSEMNDIPEELNDIYWIEDGLVEYEISEEVEHEVRNFVNKTILNIKNEKVFEPYNITKDDNFFCGNLCGYKNICWKWKEYIGK